MDEKYDAIITGSGPNGLAAAIFLQQKGLKTAVFEQASGPGGAVVTVESTLPGFRHDLASSIHPLAFDSPFFKSLPLSDFGLSWIHPEIPFAHPLPDGSAYACYKSVDETASQLGNDRQKYVDIFSKLTNDWPYISENILSPLPLSYHPIRLARFGLKALLPATLFARTFFSGKGAQLLFCGAAAHSTLPLSYIATTSFGLVLNILAHKVGWPFPKGGAGEIIKALIAYYKYYGGELYLNRKITDLQELPDASAYIFDLTPRQLLEINGTRFSTSYRRRLSNYKYGAGVFKIDWALSQSIPFLNEKCRRAGTVHLGYSLEEIEESEAMVHKGETSGTPYILLTQQSVFDDSRAPAGKHTAWAYCHVPHGNTTDMTSIIEAQIEKVAPGFKDCIISKVTYNTAQLESLNPNLVGGDINGGKQDITQLFTRPIASISPYSTPDPRVYICSSSTPPGGGVHGMCGYHAAARVWKDHFRKG